MKISRIWIILLLSILVGLLPCASGNAQEPVVRAVLFYSPSCGHCHQVMTVDLPPLIEKYGNRLQIMVINTEPDGGQALFKAALEHYKIESAGVPLLIIANQVLIGSVQIPEVFPKLVEQYMAAGGVDWPNFPGMDEAIAGLPTQPPEAAADPTTTAPNNPATDPTPSATQSEAELPAPLQLETPTSALAVVSPVIVEPTLPSGLITPEENKPTLSERINRDLVGNLLAIAVLLGMILLIVFTLPVLRRNWNSPVTGARSWNFALLAVVGLAAAGYLAWVETQQVQAVCGPVGDCNTVQQSPYARLFDILPIGVLGVAGYGFILLAWLAARLKKGRWENAAVIALRIMTLLGVLFSIYLTFLEPFVIGATCAWCLSSAVIMSALYWIAVSQEEINKTASNPLSS